MCNIGTSQTFNQLQNKLASGNFSTGSFLVNNPSVQCCNVKYAGPNRLGPSSTGCERSVFACHLVKYIDPNFVFVLKMYN